MTEQALNSVISRSLPWAFKIPDIRGLTGTLPFDGVGIAPHGEPVYWEAKNLKKVEAFNFRLLQDHQINNLCQIKTLSAAALTLLLIGVEFGPRDKRLFVFSDPFYIRERKMKKENIHKKEFLERTNFVRIYKQQIDSEELVRIAQEA